VRALLPYLAFLAIVVGSINFFWSFAESASLGGDALNGYQSNGHYFVGAHGAYTEVDRATWEWSRLHGLSVLVTHPLALAGMGYLLFGFGFPLFMGGRTGNAQTMTRVQLVRGSGPALVTARCAARIGDISVSGPLLQVSAHPAGIVLTPPFMPPRAILAPEITRIVPKKGIFGRRLEIEHAGTDVGSPLVLFVSNESTLGRAISGLASGMGDVTRVPLVGAVRPTHPVVTALAIYGLVVNFVIIAIAVLWAIPNLGPFGMVFTLVAIGIAVVNTRAFLLRRR